MNPEIFRAKIVYQNSFTIPEGLVGRMCIVAKLTGITSRVWFTEGPVHSMNLPNLCLSRVNLSSAEG